MRCIFTHQLLAKALYLDDTVSLVEAAVDAMNKLMRSLTGPPATGLLAISSSRLELAIDSLLASSSPQQLETFNLGMFISALAVKLGVSVDEARKHKPEIKSLIRGCTAKPWVVRTKCLHVGSNLGRKGGCGSGNGRKPSSSNGGPNGSHSKRRKEEGEPTPQKGMNKKKQASPNVFGQPIKNQSLSQLQDELPAHPQAAAEGSDSGLSNPGSPTKDDGGNDQHEEEELARSSAEGSGCDEVKRSDKGKRSSNLERETIATVYTLDGMTQYLCEKAASDGINKYTGVNAGGFAAAMPTCCLLAGAGPIAWGKKLGCDVMPLKCY